MHITNFIFIVVAQRILGHVQTAVANNLDDTCFDLVSDTGGFKGTLKRHFLDYFCVGCDGGCNDKIIVWKKEERDWDRVGSCGGVDCCFIEGTAETENIGCRC